MVRRWGGGGCPPADPLEAVQGVMVGVAEGCCPWAGGAAGARLLSRGVCRRGWGRPHAAVRKRFVWRAAGPHGLGDLALAAVGGYPALPRQNC